MAVSRQLQMSEAEYDRWCFTVEERTEFVDGRVVFLMTESFRDDGARWYLGSILALFVEERKLGEIHGPDAQIRPRPGLRRKDRPSPLQVLRMLGALEG